MACSQLQALEMQGTELQIKVESLERERFGFILKLGKLQGEINQHQDARSRAEMALDDVKHSSDRMIKDLQEENIALRKEYADGRAEASSRYQQQQRQLAASQAQLRSQYESVKALKAGKRQLLLHNSQLSEDNQRLWKRLEAQKVNSTALVSGDQPAAHMLTTLQQQSQLLSEVQDEVFEQKVELAVARSHLRRADKQKQEWEAEQEHFQDQVARLQSQLQELQYFRLDQQHTVGRYSHEGAQQALEAKISQLQSENQILQQKNAAMSCKVTSCDKPIDDREELMSIIQGLKAKISARDAKLAKYKEFFAHQSEALSFYPPLPPFMARVSHPEPLTVPDDNNMVQQAQQQQQHHEAEIQPAVDTVPQQQLEPLRVVRESDPAEGPGTPELLAGSFSEDHGRLMQPSPEDRSSSSQGRPDSPTSNGKPASRRNRGLWAGRAVVKAAASVMRVMQHRRRAKT